MILEVKQGAGQEAEMAQKTRVFYSTARMDRVFYEPSSISPEEATR